MGHEVRNHKLKPILHQKQRQLSKRDEIGPPPLGYPPQQGVVAAVPYHSMAPSSYYVGPSALISPQQEQQLQQALADVKRHGRNERIGEIGAAAAGAFALYELHEAKVDPEHARRHKLEAKLAGAVAVGSANYAYHEHKEKKKSEHLVEVLGGGGRNTSTTNKKKESLLAIASGHKHDSSKKKNEPVLALPASGHKHDSKKEKQNVLQILSGDGRNNPMKHQLQGQKQKPHRLHLW